MSPRMNQHAGRSRAGWRTTAAAMALIPWMGLAAAAEPASAVKPTEPETAGLLGRTNVFVSGRDGYHTYRIPRCW